MDVHSIEDIHSNEDIHSIEDMFMSLTSSDNERENISGHDTLHNIE